ncbi:MAG: galactose mutarotase [Alistipes sp.]|nr:galactose mutarotase [Candidatus Alistipes equi]
MTIEQHIWGATPEGEAIVMYTMRNTLGSEVRLSNIGAGIVSVKFADSKGKVDDVVLGYSNPMSYFGDGAAAGKTVGRVANRIAKGHMVIEGVEYDLEINNGENHLHGGSKGFMNRLWESSVETNRVVFSLLSDNMDQGYPGEVNAQVIYDFDDENSLEITLMAKSDSTTALNLTNHTYWNLSGENSGEVLDHILKLNCSHVLEMNDKQIPTGKLLDVKGTEMDFTMGHNLRDGIHSSFNHISDFKGYDHFFVMDGWKKNILSPLGTLYDPKSGRKVEILTSQPGCMVYTGNYLASGCPVTKSGGRYEDYCGVAIECQGYPDAVNHPEFPSVILNEGELYCNKIVFRLGTN